MAQNTINLGVPVANRNLNIQYKQVGPFRVSTKSVYTLDDVTAQERGDVQQLFDATQVHSTGGTGKDVKIYTGVYKSLKVQGVYSITNPLAQSLFESQKFGLKDKVAKFKCRDYISLFPTLHGKPVVFHATQTKSIDSVLSNGFNQGWAGSATAAAYGRGVYFALNPMKADQYADYTDQQAGQFALLICTIQPGCTIDWVESCTPPQQPSTRQQKRQHRKNCFQDNEERILKVIKDTNLQYDGIHLDAKRAKARYDEFVVYGSAINAVTPAYIITYTRQTYSSVAAQK